MSWLKNQRDSKRSDSKGVSRQSSKGQPTIDPNVLDHIKLAISGAQTGDRSSYATKPKRDLRSVGGTTFSKSSKSFASDSGSQWSDQLSQDSLSKLKAQADAQALKEHVQIKSTLYDKVQKGELKLEADDDSSRDTVKKNRGNDDSASSSWAFFDGEFDSEDEAVDAKNIQNLDRYLDEQRRVFQAKNTQLQTEKGERSSSRYARKDILDKYDDREEGTKRNPQLNTENRESSQKSEADKQTHESRVVSIADLQKMRDERSREIFESLRKGLQDEKGTEFNPDSRIDEITKRIRDKNKADSFDGVDLGVKRGRRQRLKEFERSNWEDPSDDDEYYDKFESDDGDSPRSYTKKITGAETKVYSSKGSTTVSKMESVGLQRDHTFERQTRVEQIHRDANQVGQHTAFTLNDLKDKSLDSDSKIGLGSIDEIAEAAAADLLRKLSENIPQL